MEFQDFLEKFANDNPNIVKWKGTMAIYSEGIKHFSEVLANYTALICEKQREMCAEAYFDYDEGNYDGSFDMENVSDAIANAPQPKINDL